MTEVEALLEIANSINNLTNNIIGLGLLLVMILILKNMGGK